MSRAIESWARAQVTISSPGWVSSSFGRRTSTLGLFSGKRPKRLAGEAVHGPLRVRFRAEPLVEADRVLVPVQHRPFQPPAAAVARDLCQAFEQRPTDAS